MEDRLAVTIRQAATADIDTLVELGKTTFRDTYRLLSDPDEIDAYVTKHFTRAILASILADPRSMMFVALNDDRFVGYMHLRRSPVPQCVTGPAPIEVARIYLRQEMIGSGVGAQLMRLAFKTARDLECQTLWLSVYDRNVHAVKFYRRFGFVDVGTKDFLFGEIVYQDPVMAVTVSSL